MQPDLIERLEKASGPSKKLDEAIFNALGFETFVSIGMLHVRNYTGDVHITASIDAALALVEKVLPDHYGYGWHKASYMPSVPIRTNRICAEIWNVESGLKITSGHSDKHLAIAILIALLRALQKQDNADV